MVSLMRIIILEAHRLAMLKVIPREFWTSRDEVEWPTEEYPAIHALVRRAGLSLRTEWPVSDYLVISYNQSGELIGMMDCHYVTETELEGVARRAKEMGSLFDALNSQEIRDFMGPIVSMGQQDSLRELRDRTVSNTDMEDLFHCAEALRNRIEVFSGGMHYVPPEWVDPVIFLEPTNDPDTPSMPIPPREDMTWVPERGFRPSGLFSVVTSARS